jgi:hypothetical protein
MTDIVESNKTRIVNEYSALERNVTEQTLFEALTTMSNQLQNLPHQLQQSRQLGYACGADLEPTLLMLSKQWRDVEDTIRHRVQSLIQRLRWELRALQDTVNQMNAADSASAPTFIARMDGELSRIRNQFSDAKREMLQSVGNIPDQLQAIADRLSKIAVYMKRVSEASFPFNPGESVFLAVEAEWHKGEGKKERPDGVFYVTNQRLIMEQKEKKGGFLGIGGHQVQQLAWEAPLSTVQSVSSENTGLFGNVDLVHLKLSNGDPAPETTVEVTDAKAEWFAAQLQRALRDEIEQEHISH